MDVQRMESFAVGKPVDGEDVGRDGVDRRHAVGRDGAVALRDRWSRRSEPRLTVRSPGATRPWQHVLDCLSGYLQLGAHLLGGRLDAARAWNFGPDSRDTRTVADLLASMQAHWPGLRWEAGRAEGPHEALTLSLNSDRARKLLGWRRTWSFDEATRATSTWYKAFLESGTILSREQLAEFGAASDKLVQRKLESA